GHPGGAHSGACAGQRKIPRSHSCAGRNPGDRRDRVLPRLICFILRTMEAHPKQFEEPPQWTSQDSAALYMIDRWGAGYFDVNAEGDMTVAPLQEPGAAIPIIAALREA